MIPHLDSYSPTDAIPEILGKRIWRDRKNVRGITYVHMCRKDDFSGRDD